MINFDKIEMPVILSMLHMREDAPLIYKTINISIYPDLDKNINSKIQFLIRNIVIPVNMLCNSISNFRNFNTYVTHNKFIALNVELEQIEKIYDQI